MDSTEAIRKRRAVRTYTDREVPDELLDRLLRLALSAPTGSGAQAWSLMVVRDSERRRRALHRHPAPPPRRGHRRGTPGPSRRVR